LFQSALSAITVVKIYYFHQNFEQLKVGLIKIKMMVMLLLPPCFFVTMEQQVIYENFCISGFYLGLDLVNEPEIHQLGHYLLSLSLSLKKIK